MKRELKACAVCGVTMPRKSYPSSPGKLEGWPTYLKRRFCSRSCFAEERANGCGTPTGPNLHRRRGERPCAECTTAHREWRRREMLSARGVDPNSVTHGAFSGGMVGCQCDECLPWHPVQHGTANAYDTGCRCLSCQRAKVAAVDAWRQPRNNASLDTAHRHHEKWRVPELEIVARDDLALADMAVLLGRTIEATRSARHRLKNDPDAIERGFTTGSRT
jgi:hypothetical protein